MLMRRLLIIIFASFLLVACQAGEKQSTDNSSIHVLAVESFLADIAQNVAGDAFVVDTLIPVGVDPHGFEITPQDLVKIQNADILIINGCGFESWIQDSLSNVISGKIVIESCKGLVPRIPGANEISGNPGLPDPHYWLDPVQVIQYVKNIRDGFISFNPEQKELYTTNSEKYINQLEELDRWIEKSVAFIPLDQRKIITNHESFGYFADRYHFQIIGTIIPSISSEASPSAQQLTELVNRIQLTGTKVIFLETGSNPQLADQIAAEIKIKVVSNLFTHSLTSQDGNAPTYIEMMKWNTNQIVEALKK
jgi:ABC-type Zn uptake system ZnuABC Zn-binding protein ZnuA